MDVRLLLKGIATYILGLYRLYKRISRYTAGTTSARYCYAVWLRHLAVAYQNNLSIEPEVIAELGPGDSLGVGLAALISGANRYYALDVVENVSNRRNIEIFDELVELFKGREKIPDKSEFPQIKPYLESHDFLNYAMTDERLNNALKPSRIESIKKLLSNFNRCDEGSMQISYFVLRDDSEVTKLIKEGRGIVLKCGKEEHFKDAMIKLSR